MKSDLSIFFQSLLHDMVEVLELLQKALPFFFFFFFFFYLLKKIYFCFYIKKV